MRENLFCINGEKCSHKGFIRDGSGSARVLTCMTFLSLYIPSLSFLFFFYYPSLFHIEDCLCVTSRLLLAVARFKFSLAYVKIYLDRVALASVGLLWLSSFLSYSISLSLLLALALSLYLSAFPRYWDALGGISSGEDATFRINRPVGLKPVPESRNGEFFRPRRDEINA